MTDFPTLDPEFASAVAALPGGVSFTDVQAARASFERLIAPTLAELAYDGVSVSRLTVPGLDGAPDVEIRFFTPADRETTVPLLVWIHGGGFVIGRAEHDDPLAVDLVRRLGIGVASVEYRRAPEHPFPAALDDCYAVLIHVHTHAHDFGIDADRIAVGGQSAGGGLAAGLALRARDDGAVPIVFQLLDIPELDDRLGTPSMTRFVDTPIWHRPNAALSWRYYLGDAYTGPQDSDVPSYAAPARATDLSGLPPAYVATMELDPLRDEGIEYALAMLRAGVSVELHSYPGTFHGSGLFRTAAVSKRAHSDAIAAVGRGLDRR
ncbi:alpha/beta hydrolase [Gordonia sp. ABSL11-1]|uniref:alpha/beta hydrolase n=1 Tax=Gordonia sp. ABSL11-1 TaxID=3053924 RepID=UPI0025723F78|nr:alpha/beta hydrolase [Gordonia sp. ABSL11-1]MDL9949041.1 alpha/beta hydrolase [Gordonia sp. ABSL11-1]